ncbi:hypothetical protein [Rhizobium sp. BE258]|uniref:hypothetical protein n=1 Tax=Rhizobium sp. BE258 TaxID=2817722 RepID=UPI00286AB9AB|nr:hypothetical protein [Rhizobium sp. BE258]
MASVHTATALPVAAPSANVDWFRQANQDEVGTNLVHQYETSFEMNSAAYQATGRIFQDRTTEKISISAGEIIRVEDTPSATAKGRADAGGADFVLPADRDVQIRLDASAFAQHLKEISWRPNVWQGDDEVVFEWISGNKHAVVSVEGDGVIGYTMLVNGDFVSGAEEDPSVDHLPSDLRDYLIAA